MCFTFKYKGTFLENLNEYQLHRSFFHQHKIEDNSTVGDSGVVVYFRNLEKKLISHIDKAHSVFGAVAWLTNGPILDAMSRKEHVQIVVQKEDFLKPDLKDSCREHFTKKLRERYARLNCNILRGEFEYWLLGLTIMCQNNTKKIDDSLDAVRCVGNYNKDKKPAFPRMHNKFLVFADVEVASDFGYPVNVIKPYAVWTGSFNFSHNGSNSLENALYITDQKIVDAYFKEYTQIAAISEPLDWTNVWMSPEWPL